MSTITYGQESFGEGEIKVYSGGLRVGTIRPVETGWRYFPKGVTNPKKAGEVFQSISAVKRDLEG